eukprot:CAMPEP_0174834860 /NCGR_PEP_ID=MMETSP1114-20130205/5091_1 /TAXON_ID=312471 /ORGANISM="Neobodo designis, Strain CCAP 1951/1" /LENGTH=162 /DNA_ID=CAMNT_0016068789 /DNA_START=41 /DNA_END=525 /DNA_ORIENTATION=+
MPAPPFVEPFAPFVSTTTLEDVRRIHDDFSNARDWRQYHTPRNLALALAGEVGEVTELFQWRSDEACANGLQGFTNAQRQAVADELSDVLAYVVRLSTACGIDLGAAYTAKMEQNARKYPADVVRGSAAKYTELRSNARTTEGAATSKASTAKPKGQPAAKR